MIFHSQMKAGQEGPCGPFLFVEDLWRDESRSPQRQCESAVNKLNKQNPLCGFVLYKVKCVIKLFQI